MMRNKSKVAMLKNKVSPMNLRDIRNLKGSFYEKTPSSKINRLEKPLSNLNLTSKVLTSSRNNRMLSFKES